MLVKTALYVHICKYPNKCVYWTFTNMVTIIGYIIISSIHIHDLEGNLEKLKHWTETDNLKNMFASYSFGVRQIFECYAEFINALYINRDTNKHVNRVGYI